MMLSLQDLYRAGFDLCGHNEVVYACLGNWGSWFVFFWGINAILLYCDITGHPKWIVKYKVQEGVNTPVDPKRLRGALKVALQYTVVSNGLGAYLIYLAQKARGCSVAVEDVPSWIGAFSHVAVYIVIQEILFYLTHRMLHIPYLYKRIHKMHHTWTAPIGITSIYAHPVEYTIGNVFPVLAGPFLLKSHMAVFWVWMAVMNVITISHHSGYHFPLLPSPEFHDYHHLKFNSNYGTWGPMDWIFGTDDMFRGTIQHKRNKYLLGSTPVSVTYPDPKTSKDKAINNGTKKSS